MAVETSSVLILTDVNEFDVFDVSGRDEALSTHRGRIGSCKNQSPDRRLPRQLQAAAHLS